MPPRPSKRHRGAVLCLLLFENHFSDTTHPRHSFRNAGIRMQCRQLKEEDTSLPGLEMTHPWEPALHSGTCGDESFQLDFYGTDSTILQIRENS